MVIKFLARLSFKLLMISSIPLVLFGYWPNHHTPAIKLLFLEYCSMMLGVLCFFVERQRKAIVFPMLLCIISMVNMFTHGLNAYTQTGVAYVFFFALAFYSICNFIDDVDSDNLKWVVVWCAVINSTFAIGQYFKYSPAMDYTQHSLPMGFMTYPCLSSLLASIGIILVWPRQKLLLFIMVACLLIRPEASILIGLLIVAILKYHLTVKNNKYALFSVGGFLMTAIILIVLNFHKVSDYVSYKLSIRLGYWLGAFHHFWSRPLDGWGIGGWNYFVGILFPNTPPGAWNELHNEPLQMLFELGLIGLIMFIFWGNHLIKNFKIENRYSLCLIVFLTASLGHSIFHFADGIWLFLIIYILWETSIGKSNKAREPGKLAGSPAVN